jgi:oligopeptide transport system substrate-binding protein
MARPGKAEVCTAIALVLTLLLAACGDDSDTAQGGEPGGHVTTACRAPAVSAPPPAVAPRTPATPPAAGTPVVGGTLQDIQNFASGPQDHIDPATAAILQGAQISQLLYDGLTEYDFTNRDNPVVKPAVAESFSSNEAADVWTFKLRKDVVFSDGTPVTASDFKCAWEQVVQPDLASEIAYILEIVKGAKAVEEGQAREIEGIVADDAAGTLTVTLEKPFADFPGVVSHPVFSPKPRAAIAATAAPGDWERQVMIGNGPFKMTKPWSSEDQELVLERNDKYFGGIEGHQAYLDRIQFKVSKDLDSAYTDFEAGAAQTGFIPSGKFREATEKYPDATEPNLGSFFFAFNMEDEQVGGPKNLKLRQAISLALDRRAINDAVYNGSRRLPTGLTPPGLPGFERGLCGDFCPETAQLDRARALLDEWKAEGGTLDTPIKVNFNAGAGHEDLVNVMEANLREIGIPVQQDPRDSKTYFAEMRRGDCVVCRAGWIWDYPIYDNGVYAQFHSASINGDNLARINDPDIDRLIGEARAETDAAQRGALYRQAEKRALDVMAVVPVTWYAGQIVYVDKVTNLRQTPLQFVIYENIWLKP